MNKIDMSGLSYGDTKPSLLLTNMCNNCKRKFSVFISDSKTDTAKINLKKLSELKGSVFVDYNETQLFNCACGEIINLKDIADRAIFDKVGDESKSKTSS